MLKPSMSWLVQPARNGALAARAIAFVEDGDPVVVDIPRRTLRLDVPDAVLAERRSALEAAGGYRPEPSAPAGSRPRRARTRPSPSRPTSAPSET